jgi:hypothetical protein
MGIRELGAKVRANLAIQERLEEPDYYVEMPAKTLFP